MKDRVILLQIVVNAVWERRLWGNKSFKFHKQESLCEELKCRQSLKEEEEVA